MASIRFLFSFLILLLLWASLVNAQLTNFGNLYFQSIDSTVVFGDLTNESAGSLDANGVLIVKGNLTNTGTFDQDAGLILMNGASQQFLVGNCTYYFLTLNNSNGTNVSSGQHSIRHTLTILNGVLETNDSVVLLSDINLTGRIAEIQGTGDINGDITQQRYIFLGAQAYHMLGVPVSGITIEDWDDDIETSGFTGSDYPALDPSIYWYDEAVLGGLTSGYEPIMNVTENIETARGYWVYFWNLPVTVSVKGPPNKFMQNIPVSKSYFIFPSTNDGWNLVSNPYPSEIDWDAAGWNKSDVDDAIYIYKPEEGVYASYVNKAGTNGGTSLIPSSQAFWVKANTLFPPSIQAEETVKTSNNQGFQRNGFDISKAPLLRLYLRSADSTLKDETLLRFLNLAAPTWDGLYDAYKLEYTGSKAPYIATKIESDSQDISINSLPEIVEGIEIPLRVKVKKSGDFFIRSEISGDLDPANCLYLEDRFTGLTMDLKSEGTYHFNIKDTTEYPRFVIHTRPVVDLGPDTIFLNTGNLVLNAGHHASYHWSTGASDSLITVTESGTYSVEVFNAYGCSNSDTVVVISSVGEDLNVYSKEIQCYPNPVLSVLEVSGLNPNVISEIRVADAVGRSIVHITQKFPSSRTIVDTETWKKGLYVVEVKSGDKHFQLKLVKE